MVQQRHFVIAALSTYGAAGTRAHGRRMRDESLACAAQPHGTSPLTLTSPRVESAVMFKMA